jgi:RNA polymerase sigma-70 factor (ECF subfamily)
MEKATTVPLKGTDEAMNDDAVLVRLAQENPAALGALYERYRDRVYWYLLARMGSEEDAADLTQQVFLQALSALPRYEASKGTFLAWLIGMARHAAINLVQRRHAYVSVEWDLHSAAADPVSEIDLEASVLHREALDRLRRLVAALEPSKQELLVLRFVAGLTAAEIGTVIHKSEAAAKKQLARTLHRLKEQHHDFAQ